MARQVGKLSPAAVKHANMPGRYGDGGDLYLNVGPTGGKSWLFRFMLDGRARGMGLGAVTYDWLGRGARAGHSRTPASPGRHDPLDLRSADKARKAAEAATAISFRKAAESCIKAHRAVWRNEKHAWQWSATLETYAFPLIGDLPVDKIDTGHVTQILEPIWSNKAETAARIRGRIEAILDYAKTHAWRTGENPARWKGHLENVLPARAKVAKVEHHSALPWPGMGGFMRKLNNKAGIAALALRFATLTAARTNEVIGAIWSEIDLQAAIWTVPGERMKAGKDHRVPLPSRCSPSFTKLLRYVQPTRRPLPCSQVGRLGGARSP
jgi:hypothetical protein